MREGVLAGSLGKVMVVKESSQILTIGSRFGFEHKSHELPSADTLKLSVSAHCYLFFALLQTTHLACYFLLL